MEIGQIIIHESLLGRKWNYKVLDVKDGKFLLSFGDNPEIELGWFSSLEEIKTRLVPKDKDGNPHKDGHTPYLKQMSSGTTDQQVASLFEESEKIQGQ